MRALNPVLRRELIERWRGRRAFAVITAYVAVLAGVMQLLYMTGQRTLADQLQFGGFDAVIAGPVLGRFLFENLLAFVMMLVLFVAPGYAAAQISGERERQTLRLLQATLLRPVGIVIGKLGASVAWVVLLVLAALPFGAAAFFLGGVTVGDLVRAVATILIVALGVAGIALGISALTRKTTASIVLTYGTVLALVLGTLFAGMVETVLRRDEFAPPRQAATMFLNPFFGLADATRADESRYGYGGQLPSVLAPFADQLINGGNNGGGFGRGGIIEVEAGVGFPVPPMPAPMPAPVEDMPLPEGLEAELKEEAARAAIAEVDGVALELAQPIDELPPELIDPGFGEVQQPVRRGVWVKVSAIYGALGLLGLVVATLRVGSVARPDRTRRSRGPRARGGAAVQPSTDLAASDAVESTPDVVGVGASAAHAGEEHP